MLHNLLLVAIKVSKLNVVGPREMHTKSAVTSIFWYGSSYLTKYHLCH